MRNLRRILVTVLLGVLSWCEISAQSRDFQICQSALAAIKEGRYQDSVTLLENGLSEADPEYVQKYNLYLGFAHFFIAADCNFKYDFEEARRHYLSSAEFYDQASSIDNQISSLLKAVGCELQMSHFSEAEKMLDVCAVLARKIDSPKRISDVLTLQRELAEKSCDYSAVERILSELFTLFESSSDVKIKLEGFRVLTNDAVNAHNYEFANFCADRYMRIVETLPEDKSFGSYYIACLLKFNISRYSGKNEDALIWALRKHKALTELSPDTFDVALALCDIMWCYADIKDYGNLHKYLSELTDYLESADISVNNRRVCCSTIGMICLRAGEHQKALSFLKEAEVYAAGDKQQEYEISMQIGAALFQAGLYEESHKYYARLLEVSGEIYGNPSREYAEALTHLANIEAFCGLIDDGSEHFIQAFRMNRDIIRSQWKYASGNSREKLWLEVSSMFFQMAAYSIDAGHSSDEFTAAAYDALLLSKGLMLATEKSFAKAVKNDPDPSVSELYSEIVEIQRRLSKGNPENSAELYAALRATESALAKKCSSFVDYTSFLDVSYPDVINSLSDNEAVVDFTDYVSSEGSHRYSAFVLRKGNPYPELLQVFTQGQLDSLSVPVSRPDILYRSDNSRSAYEIIWKPLEAMLKGCDTVYLVPSGKLHQIAVEALALPSGDLLGDVVNIVRLTSAREAIGYASNMEKPGKAVLYGGLDYSSSQYDSLPMSGREVKMVDELLKQKGAFVDVLSGQNGSTASFLSLDGHSSDILHLATHGYSSVSASNPREILAQENSMMRFGIVLSDGELPAGEIAGMDLSSTGLVVMALCKSGSGEIVKEGVYGLQRAFKKAGARTLLMTLWNVDDSASKDFMESFYRSFLNDGNIRNAFCEARGDVRKKYRSPYYWAGFVLLD